MKILIIGFFTIFLLFSVFAILSQIKTLKHKSKNEPIELYDNADDSTHIEQIYNGKLSDAPVNSSVKCHNYLYQNTNDYEKYKNNIRTLELP